MVFPTNGETFESAEQFSLHLCQDNPYDDQSTAAAPTSLVSGGSCGTLAAADGISREVFIESGVTTCAEAMTVMHATYPVLYDKPLDGMSYGSWTRSINPAGEVFYACRDPEDRSVVVYRSDDDPYR